MKREKPILNKSYLFALETIKLYQSLKRDQKFIIAKQLLRSRTSIGANVEEAQGAQRKKDFINKLSVAYKEARETHYWIRIIRDSDIIEKSKAEISLKKCEELLKMIGSAIKTLKQTLNS